MPMAALMRRGVADRDDPAVVGHVQRLVRIGRPRVGRVDPGREVSVRRRGRRPQPEGAVDVHPGVVLVGQRRRTPSNGSNAPECRLPACSSTSVGAVGPAGQGRAQVHRARMRPCAVDIDELRRGQPERSAARGRPSRAARAPASTRTAGPPARPRDDVPARPGGAARPGRRRCPVKLAMVAPVANPTAAARPAGRGGRAASDRPPPRRRPSPASPDASRRSGPRR